MNCRRDERRIALAIIFIHAGLALACSDPQPPAPTRASDDPIQAALASPDRSVEDRERDANRHPAEILAFAGIEG